MIATNAGHDELQHNLHILGALLEEVILPEALAGGRGERNLISKAQLSALRFVHNHPGAAPGQAAKALGISAPSMTTLLQRLAEKGWLAKTAAADDQRGVTLALTAAGQEVLNAVESAHKLLLQNLLAGMSAADQEHLRMGLRGLLAAAAKSTDRTRMCLHCGLCHTDHCILAAVNGIPNIQRGER